MTIISAMSVTNTLQLFAYDQMSKLDVSVTLEIPRTQPSLTVNVHRNGRPLCSYESRTLYKSKARTSRRLL